MSIQDIIAAFQAAGTPFDHCPAGVRSTFLVGKQPPFTWLNLDRLLRFRESDGVRTYEVEFRAITIVGDVETARGDERLLVEAGVLAANTVRLLRLKGDRGEVQYSPVYAEDADAFSGMQVRFTLRTMINDCA